MPQDTLSEACRIASSILKGSGDRERTLGFACELAAKRTGADVNAILDGINDGSSRSPFYYR